MGGGVDTDSFAFEDLGVPTAFVFANWGDKAPSPASLPPDVLVLNRALLKRLYTHTLWHVPEMVEGAREGSVPGYTTA